MSKIGQKTISVPQSVTFEQTLDKISVKGSQGTILLTLPQGITLKREGETLTLSPDNTQKKTRSLHGLYRQLVYDAVVGVETPWQKRMEIVGTGFNVKLQGEDLVFKVGYSHTVIFKKVNGISYKVEGNNKIVVLGADKQLVGQIAYQIKLIRKPDAYKGKGIRYEGEQLRIKPGKKAKAAGAPA